MVGGTWEGSFTQGSTTCPYRVTLNQAQTTLEGVATTQSHSAFGTMRVKGFTIGRYVVLQETEVLDRSAGSSWCLKTLETTLTPGITRALAGTWSAVGCIPGSISVQQP